MGYLNETCFTLPSVPTSAVASLPYACNGVPKAGTTGFVPDLTASGSTYCTNMLPLNAGRNNITGPHFSNLDFSVHKVFPIRRISEQFNVQFRAEIFDIFNHANFNPPQPNSGADTNAALLDSTGAYQGVGNIQQVANLQTPSREIQFALKVNW